MKKARGMRVSIITGCKLYIILTGLDRPWEGGREGGGEGGGREGGREGEREGGREGGREREREFIHFKFIHIIHTILLFL